MKMIEVFEGQWVNADRLDTIRIERQDSIRCRVHFYAGESGVTKAFDSHAKAKAAVRDFLEAAGR